LPVNSVEVHLWGVPADPSHDDQRGTCLLDGGTCPSDVAPVAFLTNPMNCSAGPLTTRASIDFWDAIGTFEDMSFDHDVNGVPMAVDNCGAVPFAPSMQVSLDTSARDVPAGLNVDLTVPQDGLIDPDGLGTAHVKKVQVTLPEGMAISPAAADGLA